MMYCMRKSGKLLICPSFKNLKVVVFESNLRKGENASNKHCFLFQQDFLTVDDRSLVLFEWLFS